LEAKIDGTLNMSEFQFVEFCNLDNSPDAEYLIESMDVMSALPSIKAIKQEAINMLDLMSGDNVLEAGCGNSIDVNLIYQKVGQTGKVIGIDASQKMIEIAKARTSSENIIFLNMDAANIGFPDEFFNACHADRLLISHANYKEIFTELIRVVKKGGRVCIVDVDALSICISPEITHTDVILNKALSSFVNVKMGRRLLNLYVSNYLKNIKIKTNLCEITNFYQLNQIFDFSKIIKSCIDEGTLTQGDADLWINNMIKYSDNSNFYYCVTFFTLSGIVP
jgi:ubiquinone/menaquinone biosynthesis C-methylase UbiE